jgi:DNA-binding transcriptional LysR family regulator
MDAKVLMLGGASEGQPRGTLRITAPHNFGAHSLVGVLTNYLAMHPETSIELTLTDRFVDLISEGFEVAFRIGDPRIDSSSVLVFAARMPGLYRLGPADAYGVEFYP